jgi:hypothetical protein
MEKRDGKTQAERSVSYRMEGPMTPTALTEQTKPSTPLAPCAHNRIIDDVLGKNKKRTGLVRCVECGAVFDDPFRGLK